jgi:PAS domain S-box-containing protein
MGSWWWDPETDEMTWSESLYRLLPIKPSGTHPTQKQLTRASHPDDRKKFNDELQLTLSEKREARFEFRIFRLGELRQVCASFKLMPFAEKEWFIGTLQDITPQHRLQHQLFMQAQQATYITENMLDRAVITDTENTVLVWNKRCEEAYNIKKEAATGKNIFELLPHLKNSEDLGLFNRALEGETIFLPQSKSGSGQEYHDLHLIPLKDEDGNVSGILHLLHDVTKEREMQQRLRERLNFIESLVEASVDRILVMDRYMNYLYCNQKAADYYKIRKEDIIGKNVLEVFPASVNDPTHDHFRKALKGETVHIPAIEGLSEAHYYEVFLIPIKDESEAVSAVLWIHHDLSGEIIMQRELRKSHQILNTVDAVFIELDHDDRIVYVNDSAKSYLNDTGEELSGKVIWEVLPGAEGSKEQEVILRAHTEKQITEAEYFSKHHNRWVFISVVPSADDGLIVFLYDRQDIKEIEQKLAEEHRRLKEAQAIGHIGSFEWNAATDTIHWSDEMFRIHGLEPQSETPTLERVLSFIYPQDDKETAAKLVQYRNEAAAATLTYKIKRPDGAIRVVTRQLQSFADAAGAVTHLSGTLQDVTEQVLASETIQQMLDGSIAAICLLDSVRNEEGGIIDFIFKGCNKAAERLNQIPAEAITGQRLLELFPGVKNVFFDGYVQVVESGLPLREQRYYPYEHYNHWFDVSAVKNGDGIIMTFYDITAQKIAEQELNESKAFTEEITRTTPDLITIHDAVSNKIIYANHGKLWSNKLTEDEVLAAPDDQRIALLIHPDDQGKAKDFMQQRRLLADGDILEVELRDQQWGHVKIRSKVFKRDAAGNAIQIISFTTNITTQRRHEDELFKNLNLLKQAEEVAGMGSWEYRIAEDKMTWSEGMYQLFDIKPGSNVKKETYLDHVLKEDRPVAKSFIKKLSAGAESIDETLSITFKSTGVRKIIRIKGTVVKDQNGNPERVLGVDLDITDLQRTEEQLRALNRSLDLRNKELQAKNEELASFSFIASHDLREPLRKIHTFSDWLLQSEREHLTETGKNYLDRMAASVKRMDRLINDVLVLTKLQTLPLTPEAVDLNALVNTVKAELAQSIRQTKTTLESDALPVITGDRAQLQHLLQNLLSNAITFQKPGNTPVVAITTRTVTATEAMALGLDANRSYARICVADNGIGFDKSYEHKIFQIFQRLHARSEYEGTGIGLTICKKVIENHKGTITADSTPGKGSLFCCYLPVDIP